MIWVDVRFYDKLGNYWLVHLGLSTTSLREVATTLEALSTAYEFGSGYKCVWDQIKTYAPVNESMYRKFMFPQEASKLISYLKECHVKSNSAQDQRKA